MSGTEDYTQIKTNKTIDVGDAGHVSSSTTKYAANFGNKLTGFEGSKTYLKMSLDGVVSGMEFAIINPIKSCKWRMPPKADFTSEEIKVNEMMNDYFFKEKSWTLQLNQILTFVRFGFSAFERTWAPFEWLGETFMQPVLHQRLQPSITDIRPVKENGVDPYVQQTTINKGSVKIPLADMAMFILDENGLDLRGKSMFYGAYQSWVDKQHYRQLLGIGLARAANGIPIMTCPAGTEKTDPAYIAVVELLDNLQDHERAWIIAPEGWKLDVFHNKSDVKGFIETIKQMNQEMAMSVLLQFLMLGQGGNGGSYSLSRDQSDFFLDGLQFVIDTIQECFNRQVLYPAIKNNFPNVDPHRFGLVGSNLNKKAGKELSEVIKTLTDSGYLHPTIDDEIWMRDKIEAPELSEEQVATLKENSVDDIEPTNVEEEIEADEKPTKLSESVKLSEPTKRQIKSRDSYISMNKSNLQDYMIGNLTLIRERLVVDIKKVLNTGDIVLKGLNEVHVNQKLKASYRNGLEKKFEGYAKDGWNNMRKQAEVNKVKLAESNPQKELKWFAINHADTLTRDQIENMRDKAILTAQNGVSVGMTTDQTIAEVTKVTDKFIDSGKISVGADYSVTKIYNNGQNAFNKTIVDQLWGYEFIAVDDGKTTEICLWYNQRTFSADSSELVQATPPLHANCRSWLQPIYKVEEKPALNNEIAPPSIQKQKQF